MICQKCKAEIPEGEDLNLSGQTICEDCYVEAVSIPTTCDIAAVHSAKMTRKLAGHEGTDGLTDLQKEIYEYVKEKGKITPEDLASHFKLSILEVQRQFATLRHCELLKGTMINGVKYVLVMDGGPGTYEL